MNCVEITHPVNKSVWRMLDCGLREAENREPLTSRQIWKQPAPESDPTCMYSLNYKDYGSWAGICQSQTIPLSLQRRFMPTHHSGLLTLLSPHVLSPSKYLQCLLLIPLNQPTNQLLICMKIINVFFLSKEQRQTRLYKAAVKCSHHRSNIPVCESAMSSDCRGRRSGCFH